MQKSLILIAALAVLILGGCAAQDTTEKTGITTTTDLETADTVNSVGQTFISESDEVQIGEMI